MISERQELSLPGYYKFIFEAIPETDKESFMITWNRLDFTGDSYVDLANAIRDTLKIWKKPNPLWLYILSRITFVQSNYKQLEKLAAEYPNDDSTKLYLARLKIYQTHFDEARKLCDEILLKIDLDRESTLIDAILLLDTLFTLGLIEIYSRNFERASEIIQEYENWTDQHKVKKWIPRDEFASFLLPPYLLRALTALYTGQFEQLSSTIHEVTNWFDGVKDLWYRGFYLNLSGISNIMANNVKKGIDDLQEALNCYRILRDRRDYSVVGANLAVTLILQGRRSQGREVLESLLDPLEELQNYILALTHTLLVSKLYMDERKFHKAQQLLNRAEKLAKKTEIKEPATFAYFAILHSRLRNTERAEYYNKKLKSMVDPDFLDYKGDVQIPDRKEGKDFYTLIWYLNATSIQSMVEGNLKESYSILTKALDIAEKENMYDSVLELSTVFVEVILKRYLIENDQKYLREAIDVIADLRPLILQIENPYYNTLIFLTQIYILIALDEISAAQGLADEVQDLYLATSTDISGDQSYELELVTKRLDSLSGPQKPEEEEIGLNVWFLGNSYHRHVATMEAIRLINDLQMQQSAIGEKPREVNVKPSMILLSKSSGQSIFSLKLSEEDDIDDQLVSALLMAISSFSKEVLGGGSLNKIEQEGHILLLEHIANGYTAVIVVNEDSYSLRKRFKKLVSELKMLRITEYFEVETLLSPGDPQYELIRGVIEEIFN